MARLLPNVVVTGTPGCGKTLHCEYLALHLEGEFTHLNISDVAKERDCIVERDVGRDTDVVDADRLVDAITPDLEKGGVLVDWHSCDAFPEDLVDLVVVLRCDNLVLYDRLTARGYKDSKVQENLDCEIMGVVAEEARESYDEDVVIELVSESAQGMEENCERIVAWVEQWKKDHPEGVATDEETGDEALASSDEALASSDE